MDQDSGSGEPRLPISKAILAVLDRHAVPERQRLATLQAAVEMSYQQVRRRMAGESPWNVDEIKRLASHFGEPLFGLLATLVDDVGKQATLQVGGTTIRCCIWLGPPAPPKVHIGSLVAIAGDSDGHWQAVPAAEAGGRKAYEIKRLIFEAAAPRRVAIVDDDDALSAAIVQFLRDKGLDAVAYRSGSALLAALEATRFDGFIVDWIPGAGNTDALLAELRDRDAEAPIIVHAGPVKGKGNQDDELAAALSVSRALLYEKPARPLSLFSALDRGFDTTPRAA